MNLWESNKGHTLAEQFINEIRGIRKDLDIIANYCELKSMPVRVLNEDLVSKEIIEEIKEGNK